MKQLVIKMSKKRKAIFLIFLILTILWAAVIYGFSSNNAAESSEQSGRITDLVLRIFVPNYDDLTLSEQSSLHWKCESVLRKAAHFSVFALLGVLSYYCVGSIKYLPSGLFAQVAVSLPFCIVFAISDEIHQKFVEGRACRIFDVGIDSLGAAFGTALAILLSLWYKRFINKSS